MNGTPLISEWFPSLIAAFIRKGSADGFQAGLLRPEIHRHERP
jgi:hypothetical protein